jgi:hypothetical protein
MLHRERPGSSPPNCTEVLQKAVRPLTMLFGSLQIRYKQAFDRPSNPSLSTLSDFPANIVSPHLFKKVAVPGICVD